MRHSGSSSVKRRPVLRRVKPGGPARIYAPPYGGGGGPARFYAHLPHPRRAAVPMGSDTFYNERRILWEVVRLVQAVTGIRTAPRRRRELHAGSTRPHTRRAANSMGSDTFYNKRGFLLGSDTLCLGCNLHEDNPAPLGRELHAGSACGAEEGAGSACRASPLLCAAIWRRFLWEVIHSIVNGGFYGK